jgi:rod shape-determining protein MreC
MNNLLKKLYYFRAAILFLTLEGVAFVLIFNHNYYPQTQMYGAMQRFQNYFYATSEQLTEYFALKKENDYLAAENAMLRSQLFIYKIADTINRRPIANARYVCYPAKIVNSTINKQYNYITLDIGENNGIRKDMGVMSNGNVVGVVTNVSAHYATVMPILNRRLKISARHKRSGNIGSLVWDGVYYRSAILTEVPQHAALSQGDSIVTSGYSALFPEGIFIGTIIDYHVQKGTYYEIQVRLAVDFNTLRYVDVLDNKMQLEQQMLEEAQDFLSDKPTQYKE